MKEIINCCLITEAERPSTWCAEKCRLYAEARVEVMLKRPYIGTGYGNLYGEPSLVSIRGEARRILAQEKREQKK